MTRTAWRVVGARWAATAFDGEGARLYGGRWNNPGTPAVYLGGSLALAALELLVHLESDRVLAEYAAIPATFDDALVLPLPPEELPLDWRADPTPPSTRAVGDAWARSGTSLLLGVPSVVVPAEHNYVLNPRHPDAARLAVGEPQAFAFDPRLLKGGGRS